MCNTATQSVVKSCANLSTRPRSAVDQCCAALAWDASFEGNIAWFTHRFPHIPTYHAKKGITSMSALKKQGPQIGWFKLDDSPKLLQVPVDEISYNSAINACVEWQTALALLAEMKEAKRVHLVTKNLRGWNHLDTKHHTPNDSAACTGCTSSFDRTGGTSSWCCFLWSSIWADQRWWGFKSQRGFSCLRGLPRECGYDWPLDLLKILTSLIRNVYTYIVL